MHRRRRPAALVTAAVAVGGRNSGRPGRLLQRFRRSLGACLILAGWHSQVFAAEAPVARQPGSDGRIAPSTIMLAQAPVAERQEPRLRFGAGSLPLRTPFVRTPGDLTGALDRAYARLDGFVPPPDFFPPPGEDLVAFQFAGLRISASARKGPGCRPRLRIDVSSPDALRRLADLLARGEAELLVQASYLAETYCAGAHGFLPGMDGLAEVPVFYLGDPVGKVSYTRQSGSQAAPRFTGVTASVQAPGPGRGASTIPQAEFDSFWNALLDGQWPAPALSQAPLRDGEAEAVRSAILARPSSAAWSSRSVSSPMGNYPITDAVVTAALLRQPAAALALSSFIGRVLLRGVDLESAEPPVIEMVALQAHLMASLARGRHLSAILASEGVPGYVSPPGMASALAATNSSPGFIRREMLTDGLFAAQPPTSGQALRAAIRYMEADCDRYRPLMPQRMRQLERYNGLLPNEAGARWAMRGMNDVRLERLHGACRITTPYATASIGLVSVVLNVCAETGSAGEYRCQAAIQQSCPMSGLSTGSPLDRGVTAYCQAWESAYGAAADVVLQRDPGNAFRWTMQQFSVVATNQ